MYTPEIITPRKMNTTPNASHQRRSIGAWPWPSYSRWKKKGKNDWALYLAPVKFQGNFKILHFYKRSGNLAPPQSKKTLSYKKNTWENNEIMYIKILAIILWQRKTHFAEAKSGQTDWNGRSEMADWNGWVVDLYLYLFVVDSRFTPSFSPNWRIASFNR